MTPLSPLRLFACFIGILLLAPVLPAGAQVATGQLSGSGDSSQSDLDFSRLTPEERAELLARLSDEEVRELFVGYLEKSESGAAAEQHVGIVESADATMGAARAKLAELLGRAGELFEVPAFLVAETSRGVGVGHFYLVLAVFAAVALAGYAVERLYRRSVAQAYARLRQAGEGVGEARRVGLFLGRLGLDIGGIAVFALVILLLFFVLYRGHEPSRLLAGMLFLAVLISRLAIVLLAAVLAPQGRSPRVLAVDDTAARRLFSWSASTVTFAAFWVALSQLLLALGIETDTLLLFQLTGGSILLLLVLACLAVARRPVADVFAGRVAVRRQGGSFRIALARQWYLFPAIYAVSIYLLSAVSGLAGGGFGSHAGLLSLLIISFYPLADFVAVGLVRGLFAGASAGRSAATPVFGRAARIVVLLIAAALFFRTWGLDLFAEGEGTLLEGRLASAVLEIGATVLVAYVLWGIAKLAVVKHLGELQEETSQGDESAASAASRLQTVVPLFLRFFQITLVIMVVMIVLSSMGVDIGPLLAGAGVVGIAIGFGAQTLVRDLVSGLFFLLDDAFRKGEYVDIGDVRGSVEAINIRSLVLRHHLGPIHTVPFGEIKHLTNYSRDWVIMKLEFRVPTNTDLQKVKKIFKKIGAEMLEHPDLGKDFLEPFKSQGVKAIEDSAIIVRGKFMSKPGRQFVIRKELFNRVQAEFQAAGIEFAHRKVTVELPPDAKLSEEQKQKVAEAAGAAARGTEEPQGEPSR